MWGLRSGRPWRACVQAMEGTSTTKMVADPFVTIPSMLLTRCPGTQKVALGEGPWVAQGAGSDASRCHGALTDVLVRIDIIVPQCLPAVHYNQ